MATISSTEYRVATIGGYTLRYRIDVILNSQDAAGLKSNITVKVFGKAGTGSYSGNGYVKLSVLGNTTVNATDQTLVAPTKITRNDYSDWTEYESLRYTGNFSHASDGTLGVEFKVVFDHTTSTNNYVPINTTISTGTVAVQTIDVGSPYSILNPIKAMSFCGNMKFVFVPATAATKHTLTIKRGGTTVKTVSNYTSGAAVSLADIQILTLLNAIASGIKLSLTVTLESFNASNTSLGTDTQTFTGYGTSIDVVDNGVEKSGLVWVKNGSVWKKGIMKVNDNASWKRGI